MNLDNVLALYNGNKKPYTDEEIKGAVTSEVQGFYYECFERLTSNMITMLNTYKTWKYMADYLNFINILLVERIYLTVNDLYVDDMAGTKDWPLYRSLLGCMSTYVDIAVFEHFLMALKDAYNLTEIEPVMKEVRETRELMGEDFKEFTKQAKRGVKLGLKLHDALLFEIKQPLYKKDYDKLLKEVSNPLNFHMSYYSIVKAFNTKINIKAFEVGEENDR